MVVILTIMTIALLISLACNVYLNSRIKFLIEESKTITDDHEYYIEAHRKYIMWMIAQIEDYKSRLSNYEDCSDLENKWSSEKFEKSHLSVNTY